MYWGVEMSGQLLALTAAQEEKDAPEPNLTEE
jgi:hypothetical protein